MSKKKTRVVQENGLFFLSYSAVIRCLYALKVFEQGTDHAACQFILYRPVRRAAFSVHISVKCRKVMFHNLKLRM